MHPGTTRPVPPPGRGPARTRRLLASVQVGLLLMLAAPADARAANALLSLPRSGDVLRRIDVATGQTLASVTISLPGETIAGGNGLAAHPQTGVVYGLVRLAGGFPPDRHLVTIDPETGDAVLIGNTGDRFAGLTFDASGTLYGVTGDGAATPSSLFTLSLSDASPTFVVGLGNGGDGEAIGFHPKDGLIYHASGLDDGSGSDTRILESIDPNSLVITNIPLDPGYSEATALTASGTELLGTDTLALLFDLSTTGGVGPIGTMDHVSKGLAWVQVTGPNVPALGPAARLLLGLLLACAALAAGPLRRAS